MAGRHLAAALASIGDSIGKSIRDTEEREFRAALEERRAARDQEFRAAEAQKGRQHAEDMARQKVLDDREGKIQDVKMKTDPFLSPEGRTIYDANLRGRTDFNQSTGVLKDDNGGDIPAAPVGSLAEKDRSIIARVQAGRPAEQLAEDIAKQEREERESKARIGLSEATARRYNQLAQSFGEDQLLQRDPRYRQLMKGLDDIDASINDVISAPRAKSEFKPSTIAQNNPRKMAEERAAFEASEKTRAAEDDTSRKARIAELQKRAEERIAAAEARQAELLARRGGRQPSGGASQPAKRKPLSAFDQTSSAGSTGRAFE